jgi:hypothetical protein
MAVIADSSNNSTDGEKQSDFIVREVRPGVINLYSRRTGFLIKGVGYYCQDCTTVNHKYMDYMAVPEVWKNAGMGEPGGMLCLACLRTRLSRDIVVGDFNPKTSITHEGFEIFLAKINAGSVPHDIINEDRR